MLTGPGLPFARSNLTVWQCVSRHLALALEGSTPAQSSSLSLGVRDVGRCDQPDLWGHMNMIFMMWQPHFCFDLL